jgi:hypothetical protein
VKGTIHVDHLVKGIIVLRSSCISWIKSASSLGDMCAWIWCTCIYTVYIYIYKKQAHGTHTHIIVTSCSAFICLITYHTHKYASLYCTCTQVILV